MTAPPLTITDVATYPRPGMDAPGMVGFTPDSAAVTWLHAGGGGLVRSLWRIDIASGARSVIVGPGTDAPLSREEELLRERTRTRELGVPAYAFARSAERPVLIIPGQTVRIAIGDEPLRELAATQGALTPSLSPDGAQLSFVRGGELLITTCDGESEPRQLTTGAADGISHGLADYIAQEEFGLLSGHWWSSDGRIAYLRVDERHVAPYPIVHQGGGAVDVETHRYPFAGDANAHVSLWMLDVASGLTTQMSLPDEDGYLVRVAWWPSATDGPRLVAQWVNRAQNRLQLLTFDQDGVATVLIDERQEPWINVSDDARGLSDGIFLWSSEQSGYRHLTLHAEDGSEIRKLTEGDWIVDGVIGVDEHEAGGGWVYFTSTRGSPLERRVERVSLAGGWIETLSEPGGVHSAVLSPDGRWLVVQSSSLHSPPRLTLLATDGGERRTLYQSDVSLDALGLTPPRLRSFAASDGTTLYGAIYPPNDDQPDHDSDNDSGKLAPLLVAVYGGPHAQTVLDAWGLTVDLRAQYLAHRGFLVLKLDNRGMAGRGLEFEAHLHRRMGTIEVDDQALAVAQLAREGLIDPSRVGVYGWSYGGYMTVMSMLRRPDLFTVGVAGAPVSDWDGYDTGYTERYMGVPQDNVEGYREGSLLRHAEKLEGDLLLIHGGVDENVHFRHTARLITALTEADRDYDLLLFPQERHMPRERAGLEYQERRVARYFERRLLAPSSATAED